MVTEVDQRIAMLKDSCAKNSKGVSQLTMKKSIMIPILLTGLLTLTGCNFLQ
ncbi:hypothetical protein LSPH24S_02411 [Lysinibacillus sphaericus]